MNDMEIARQTDLEGKEKFTPRQSLKIIVAMTVAAYQVMLPFVLLIIAIPLLIYLLLKYMLLQ